MKQQKQQQQQPPPYSNTNQGNRNRTTTIITDTHTQAIPPFFLPFGCLFVVKEFVVRFPSRVNYHDQVRTVKDLSTPLCSNRGLPQTDNNIFETKTTCVGGMFTIQQQQQVIVAMVSFVFPRKNQVTWLVESFIHSSLVDW